MGQIIHLFQYLPRDVVHIILSYDGTIKYRKGEYVNQLSLWDPRIIMLRNFWISLRLPFTMKYSDRIRTEIDFVLTPFSLFCEEKSCKEYVRYYFRTIREEIDGLHTITRIVYRRY